MSMRRIGLLSVASLSAALASCGGKSQPEAVEPAPAEVADTAAAAEPTPAEAPKELNTYVIERQMKGAGKLTPDQRKEAAAKSNATLAEMADGTVWITSYFTDDKIFCVYKAASEDDIREHAEKSGFPADKITLVRGTLDPTVGGGARAPDEAPAGMKSFVIEREMPGAGKLGPEDAKAAAARSNAVLASQGGDKKIQWVQSYVTDDKVYCVYRAKNAKLVKEHAKKAGFPADKVHEQRAQVDPTTADGG